jgi:ribosomal protein S6
VKLYEGMFLVDNDEVRNDWNGAKALVTGTLEKHGGVIQTARRWDERRLAYPIKKKNRATYLLTYFELEPGASETLRRDLDLSEKILRYLILSVSAVPEKELELTEAETAEGFTVPAPPDDDFREPDTSPQADFDFDEGRGPRRPRRGRLDEDSYEDVEDMLAGAGGSEDF